MKIIYKVRKLFHQWWRCADSTICFTEWCDHNEDDSDCDIAGGRDDNGDDEDDGDERRLINFCFLIGQAPSRESQHLAEDVSVGRFHDQKEIHIINSHTMTRNTQQRIYKKTLRK